MPAHALSQAAFAILPLAFLAAAPRSAGAGVLAGSLQPYVDRHGLAGAVALVADKDGVLDQEAVGCADIGAGKPMKTNALFWIASQSKPITVAALMMLWDEGKFQLDDPVAKYLPEFRDLWLAAEQDEKHVLLRRPAHPITVREILSHTAGMPFASALEQPTLDMLPLDVAVRSYVMTPLQFEPGTRYQYSNAGINTSGRLIEVLSGMPYTQFLKTRLLEPLGMKDTTFWPTRAQLARLAKPYKPNADKTGLEETTIVQLHYPLDDRARQPMPAGGLFSTAADCARFCRMLLNGGVLDGKRCLSEAAVREMTRKQTADSIPDGYGLGLSTGGGVFGHGGAYATNMVVDTNEGLVKVFLVQHAGFAADGDQAQGAFMRAAGEHFGKR